MRSLLDILDFSTDELSSLMNRANDMISHPEFYRHVCDGRQLATLFFEPSTRTRLSFESAMLALGGRVLTVTGSDSSSMAKGESLADTARTVSCYADIIAMRHPLEGAARVAAESATIPVINAGDGGHCHPTQTLADLFTIYREKGTFENLTVGLCGDLMYGRTVHSLIAALSRYPGVNFILISPVELQIPDYVRFSLLEKGIPFEETTSLEDALPRLDILYMTRIQQERFDDHSLYLALKDSYILTPNKMTLAHPEMAILHPLPRVNEISPDIDKDPRACYFKQVYNGKMMRMALIIELLFGKSQPQPGTPPLYLNRLCSNPHCVTRFEYGLIPSFYAVKGEKDTYRCRYCDHLAET